MKKRSELLFRLLQIPLDYLMLLSGFLLALLVREGQAKPLAYLIGAKDYFFQIVLLAPIIVVIFAILGLYSLSISRSKLQEYTRVVSGVMATTMVLILLDFFLARPIFPSKAVPVYALFLSTILIIAARYATFLLQRLLFVFGIGTHNTLILGEGSQRIEIEEMLKKDSKAYNIVENKTTNSQNFVAQLAKINSQHSLDDIFYIDTGKNTKVLQQLLSFARKNQIQLHVIPTVSELYNTQLRTARLNNLAILEVITTPLEGWGRVAKRLFDIVFGLLALILSLPFVVVISLLVLLTDFGPIFYAHKRLTRSGKTFYVYKFRTMKRDYCDGGKYGNKSPLQVIESFGDPKLVEEFVRDQKIKQDPRVSKIGRILRATSLDELPQLVNILLGQISFVGPRPIVETELARYGDESGLFLHIKPGLTGLWQVSGRNDVSYENRVKLDIYYIENWSFGMDIAILLKTVLVVLFKRSGY